MAVRILSPSELPAATPDLVNKAKEALNTPEVADKLFLAFDLIASGALDDKHAEELATKVPGLYLVGGRYVAIIPPLSEDEEKQVKQLGIKLTPEALRFLFDNDVLPLSGWSEIGGAIISAGEQKAHYDPPSLSRLLHAVGTTKYADKVISHIAYDELVRHFPADSVQIVDGTTVAITRPSAYGIVEATVDLTAMPQGVVTTDLKIKLNVGGKEIEALRTTGEINNVSSPADLASKVKDQVTNYIGQVQKVFGVLVDLGMRLDMKLAASADGHNIMLTKEMKAAGKTFELSVEPVVEMPPDENKLRITLRLPSGEVKSWAAYASHHALDDISPEAGSAIADAIGHHNVPPLPVAVTMLALSNVKPDIDLGYDRGVLELIVGYHLAGPQGSGNNESLRQFKVASLTTILDDYTVAIDNVPVRDVLRELGLGKRYNIDDLALSVSGWLLSNFLPSSVDVYKKIAGELYSKVKRPEDVLTLLSHGYPVTGDVALKYWKYLNQAGKVMAAQGLKKAHELDKLVERMESFSKQDMLLLLMVACSADEPEPSQCTAVAGKNPDVLKAIIGPNLVVTPEWPKIKEVDNEKYIDLGKWLVQVEWIKGNKVMFKVVDPKSKQALEVSGSSLKEALPEYAKYTKSEGGEEEVDADV